MIRILFTIVAVVAAILGAVLPMPELFAAAGLALLVTLILILVRLYRRRASHKEASSGYVEPAPKAEDDLSSLGILEIRPRQKSPTPPRETEEWEEPGLSEAATEEPLGDGSSEEPPPVAAKTEPARPSRGANGTRPSPTVQSTITIKEKAQIVRASVDESAPARYRDVLVPFLQAFRAAVDANTVCLLKQPAENSNYHIEAIVSLNAYARSGGTFSSKVPLLQTHDSRSATEIRRVSDDDFPPSGLGYYREAIAAKEIAVASVPRPSAQARYVLLADSMREHSLDSERSRSLTSHFARLLGAVLDKSGGTEVLDAYDYVRPRREIINEEITRSRTENRPLALALVYLNRAELIADRGERDVKNVEHALADRLRETARDARVERFGELTYGVFFAATGPEVENWAVDLQRRLNAETEGPLEGGVSIGIALLNERHSDADAFRRDATDALREAYESGTCTIVE